MEKKFYKLKSKSHLPY